MVIIYEVIPLPVNSLPTNIKGTLDAKMMEIQPKTVGIQRK